MRPSKDLDMKVSPVEKIVSLQCASAAHSALDKHEIGPQRSSNSTEYIN